MRDVALPLAPTTGAQPVRKRGGPPPLFVARHGASENIHQLSGDILNDGDSHGGVLLVVRSQCVAYASDSVDQLTARIEPVTCHLQAARRSKFPESLLADTRTTIEVTPCRQQSQDRKRVLIFESSQTVGKSVDKLEIWQRLSIEKCSESRIARSLHDRWADICQKHHQVAPGQDKLPAEGMRQPHGLTLQFLSHGMGPPLLKLKGCLPLGRGRFPCHPYLLPGHMQRDHSCEEGPEGAGPASSFWGPQSRDPEDADHSAGADSGRAWRQHQRAPEPPPGLRKEPHNRRSLSTSSNFATGG